ncbi:MAG TPA: condensation domain-containing protein [Chitinophaga sp.]|uniref:condensation domain-containing protein n=1 Tax=Chitinophaga sp. TaxID=1869181 RepID=UPI002CB09E7A|nr:condensation domain-containing protein [Chitinophaga sp.]HVI43405.1 condensation domain-containing protein [Chitinophaga sp.]
MHSTQNIHKRDDNASPVPAVDKIATEIALIWKEILGLPAVDTQQRFSDIGGNSINAIAIMYRMKKAGFPVTLRDIMHYQSIEKIVQEVLYRAEARLIGKEADLKQAIYRQLNLRIVCKSISVQYEDGIRKAIVLLTSPGGDAAIRTFIEQSAQRIAPDVLPDYVASGSSLDSLADGELFSETELYDLLELKHLEPDAGAVFRGSQLHGLAVNNEMIGKRPVAATYPMCAMQQLQISFQTPASLDFIKLDNYVSLPVLQRAYSEIIKRHSLLRSVPLNMDGYYHWQEHSYAPGMTPVIPLIDLSAVHCTEADFHHLAKQLATRTYSTNGILHQLILIRKSLKEHYLLMIFSHVIFDRVTGELLKSQLLNYYQDQLNNQAAREEVIAPFEEYVKQIARGPQQITEDAVVDAFRLREFYEAKQQVKGSINGKESDVSDEFSILVPLPDNQPPHNMLDTTLAIYARAMQRYLEIIQIPMLFVCDGRQYENTRYYNTVGEFTDMVPMLLDARLPAGELGEAVAARLNSLKQHNLNFLHLMLSPEYKSKWPQTGALMDAGTQFSSFDILMFNFLGNADDTRVATEEYTSTQPNPLPIHSLLNCIAAAAPDRLLFMFRSSYTVDIDRLRALFKEAAREVLR